MRILIETLGDERAMGTVFKMDETGADIVTEIVEGPTRLVMNMMLAQVSDDKWIIRNKRRKK